jgi:epoxyqueuosine reductase QueG
MNDPKNTVRSFLRDRGISVTGFGTIPDRTSEGELNVAFPRAIVFGFVLSKTVLETIQDRPTLIYKHHYKTVNWILDQTACHLVRFLEEQNVRAVAIPASQIVDWEHRKGHVSHIVLGSEAGLGHIGRSGLLIHPVHGAHVRYVSILTDLEFTADKPAGTSCGECRACMTACPAKAIHDNGVDVPTCYAKLNEFASIRGIGQHICGVCVKVCNGTH